MSSDLNKSLLRSQSFCPLSVPFLCVHRFRQVRFDQVQKLHPRTSVQRPSCLSCLGATSDSKLTKPSRQSKDEREREFPSFTSAPRCHRRRNDDLKFVPFPWGDDSVSTPLTVDLPVCSFCDLSHGFLGIIQNSLR